MLVVLALSLVQSVSAKNDNGALENNQTASFSISNYTVTHLWKRLWNAYTSLEQQVVREQNATNQSQQIQQIVAQLEENQVIGTPVRTNEFASSMRMPTEATECFRTTSCDTDAEQLVDGGNLAICGDANLTDLEIGNLGSRSNVVGLNFAGWNIPQGATILNARIQFTAYTTNRGPSNLTISGVDRDNPAVYSSGDNVITRPLTTTTVNWSPPDWVANESGVGQLTPELRDIIQEIVNRPTYVQGNNIGLHITGSGTRRGISYDIDPARSPELCITYEIPDPDPEPEPVECDGCSRISISSLQGVPNFPQVDILNVCSTPDTVSLLVYNSGDCPITNMQIGIALDQGLAYGGFVESHTNDQTVLEYDVSDGSNPIFLVERLDTGRVVIVNFGMTGDCNVNLENDEALNFDVNIDFFSNTSSNGVLSCNMQREGIGEFNSGIKVPVVNLLSVNPQEVDLANFTDQFCQQLDISQDGIDAVLDHLSMTVEGLDLTGTVTLGSIRVNGNVIPTSWYSYDGGTQRLDLRIEDNYFNQNTGGNSNNFFDEGERMTVEFCYQAIGCVDPAQFITYNAFYGCNNDICFDISSQQGSLSSNADFGASVNASANFNQAGQICGNDLLFDFTISSSNSHPLEGLWKDLVIKFNACNTPFSTVTGIALNGTPLPSNVWSESSGAITINTKSNTTPIGNLVDQDGDGRYDDLMGGTSLRFDITMELNCSEDPSCGSAQCSIEQIEVSGTRDCGQDFQEFATLGAPVTYGYGETSFVTYDTIEAYNHYYENWYTTVPCDEWGPAPNGFKLEYTYGTNNVASCTNSNIVAKVRMSDNNNWHMWRDIRYEANSTTYNGTPIGGIVFDYILDDHGDTTAIEFVIPAGDPNAVNHEYYFNIETSGDCRSDRHLYVEWEIVEQCPDCTGSDCEVLRSCHSTLSRIRWNGTNCICDCDFESYTKAERSTFGYTNCGLTTAINPASVPPADLNRFMPGDVMKVTLTTEILNVNALREGSERWRWRILGPHINAPSAWDNMNAVFENVYFEKAGSGVRQPLIPDCILDEFPANSSLHQSSTQPFYVELSNIGVAHTSSVDNIACRDFSNITNPTYPFDQASPNGVRYSDNSTGWGDYQLWTGARYIARNDGYDWEDDDMYIHFFFGNNLACDGALYNEDADACANALVDAYNMENGDSFHVVVHVPIVANGFHKLDSTDYNNQNINGTFNTWDQRTTNCNAIEHVGTSCQTDSYYEFHIPEVGHTTEVTVNDCTVEVEHTIFLTDTLPEVTVGQTPWYENEYRPAMGVEWIEPFFPTNMVYDGNMVIEDMNGVQTPISNQWIDDEYGNLHCEPDGFGGVCCVAADQSDFARLRIVDQAYIDGKANTCYMYDAYNKPLINRHLDPFPLLAASGAERCEFKIKYTLTALCPEDIQSSDFGLNGQFSHVYVPDFLAYNRLTNNLGDPNSGVGEYLGTPFDLVHTDGTPFSFLQWNDTEHGARPYWPFAPHPDKFSNHPSRYVTSEITTPDNFADNSNGFPPLSSSTDRLLIADEAGVNETVTYELCSGNSGGMTHDYVSATIEIPLSIELINIVSLSGTGNSYFLVETTPTHNIYAIEMRDLAPGACDQIDITTELTFCPTGTNADTRINIKANSGCLPVAKSSQLLAGLEVCNAEETAYQYIREEADIQAEWDPNPFGEYSLCDDIEMGIRIKNVKPAVLTDIEPKWWFPKGLLFKNASWEVCYTGGPTHINNCTTIPDPTPVASENSAFGTYYEYADDGIWSSYINTFGLPGVGSSLDSNKVMFRFIANTECDEFVSGTSVWFQADAADPCESRVASMQIQSNPVIIENANPNDFAQFFVFAEPTDAYCGVENTLGLTFLNISPLGESSESRVCMDLQTDIFDYTPGSVRWLSPIHNPAIEESSTGAVTTICMTIPDGIGPNEVFQLEMDFTVPNDAGCGAQTMNIQVTSTVVDQQCDAMGTVCDVDVLNTVNPQLDIDFNPPLPIKGQRLSVSCTDGDGMVDVCYEVDISNISDEMYADNITVSIIRDLDGNGRLDPYDPLLASETTPLVLPVEDERRLTGCFSVASTDACPLFLQVQQSSGCICDTETTYFDGLEPEDFAKLPDLVNICPNSSISLRTCSDWSYALSPSGAGTVVDDGNGNTVITLGSGYGVDNSVTLEATSTTGACDNVTFERKLYSLADFEVGPYTAVEVCETDCQQLDLRVPNQYRDNVEVSWSPTTFLDDPTSQTPRICQPTGDITYTVTVTFTSPDGSTTCDFTANFPIDMIEQPIENSIPDGKLCSIAESTFTAPVGYETYEWIYVAADGTESFVSVGSSNELYTETVGFYYVLYYNATDVCKTRSEIFELEYCIDYGDLPDGGTGTGYLNYETDTLNNGPAHDVEEGFYLGARVDEEYNGQPDMTATGDGADEDGFTFPLHVQWTPGSHVRLPFSVSNPSGNQAELEIWIDWNGDGDFDDPNEWAADISDNGLGDFGRNGYITIYVPEDISPGLDIGFRARLSHENNMTPYGRIATGEVEDYLLRIDCDTNVCLPVRSNFD